MNKSKDIRPYKKKLRAKCKEYRKSLTPKQHAAMDQSIIRRFLRTEEYKQAQTVLCYVSFGGEIHTHDLITTMISDGKRVGVPRCIEGSRQMDFHVIESIEELVPQSFGILEPDPLYSPLLSLFDNTVCILPGLAFDQKGYRIGYGGGYYDRFLSTHSLQAMVGICYHQCVLPELMHGRYDVSCDMIITEKEAFKVML